jgi:citrate lyase subunit beta/citryl-CoA lyase
MTTSFTSGTLAAGNRSDCGVVYSPTNAGGHKVSVVSKVDTLYGKSIEELAKKTLTDLEIKNAKLKIEDGGALPFVIMARIEAVVKMAHPTLKKEALPDFEKHAQYGTSCDRFRRSRLYLPGNQPKLMLNAGIHKPDGIILDLEDAVAPIEKFSARLIVRNALRVLDFFGAERMVRINQGELGLQDIDAIAAHNVHVILVPKVESAEQIKIVEARIKNACRGESKYSPSTGSILLMPIIESAKGILNAFSIATASKSIVALAIGLEDYTADIGTQRTTEGRESFFARSMIVNAARAAGVQAIDTVFSDVNDNAGLLASVLEAKSLGFDGKGCIHPRQIRTIHEGFAPSATEIEKAKAIVFAFDEAEKKGLGVVSLGSKMIDAPVVKRALKTIDLALAQLLIEKNWKKEFAAKMAALPKKKAASKEDMGGGG